MSPACLAWTTGAFGLLGALIGAGASIAAIWIQSRTQDRRERLRHAAELAFEDYKLRTEQIKNIGGTMPPMSLFIAYQVELLDLIEQGKFTPGTFKALSVKHDRMLDALGELVADRNRRDKGSKARR